jgi:hypothetical protein
MPHRLCMRHLVYMRTQVRAGVADGDIDVTSTAAGKVWKNMSGLIKGWSRPARVVKGPSSRTSSGMRRFPVLLWRG